MKNLKVRRLALIGLMAALVFVGSMLSIPIPISGIENTRLHLGNIFCLLSGMVLGGVAGGLSAGIGSCFFDLINPLYIMTAPFTFAFKFLMAFICGKIANSGGRKGDSSGMNAVGAIVGAIVYVLLYVSRGFLENVFFMRMEVDAALIILVQKGIVSLINGSIAVLASVPLCRIVKGRLSKSSMLI